MRYLQIVESVRRQIRAAPTARLSLEAAAADAGLSPVRLHQIFADVQGENFGAFVRRCRLEYACGLMRAFPEWSCTRVALEAGFSESSDFTRSFRRAYGIAPSRWDRVRPLNRGFPGDDGSSDVDSPLAVGFGEAPGPAEFPVAIREREACRVAVLEVRAAHEGGNLAAAFDRLEAWLDAREQRRPGRWFTGLSHDSHLETPAELYRYELTHAVDDDVAADDGILIRVLPATTAAVLPCRGGPDEFVAAWDHLLRVFLPASAWRQGNGPAMEVYYNDPRRHGMRYWDMDCVLPVTAAA